MFKFLLLSVFVAGSFANAQTAGSSRYEMESYKEDTFKISLLKPMLTAKTKVKASFEDMTDSGTSSEDADGTGFGVGYSYLPVQQLGFVGLASFITFDSDAEGSDPRATRFEGNAAYAINERVYFKGGLNFATIDLGSIDMDMNGSFGYQIGVGVKINQYIGFDFSYGEMMFKGSGVMSGEFNGNPVDVDVDTEIALRGFELGLTGTF